MSVPVVNRARRRQAAQVAAALAVLYPATMLGGLAWAATPAPAPVTKPAVGTWISGGTLQPGSAAKPAAAPPRITAPAGRPASGPSGATPAPENATVLPFTGAGQLDLLLPSGLLLVAAGTSLVALGRPRRAGQSSPASA